MEEKKLLKKDKRINQVVGSYEQRNQFNIFEK